MIGEEEQRIDGMYRVLDDSSTRQNSEDGIITAIQQETLSTSVNGLVLGVVDSNHVPSEVSSHSLETMSKEKDPIGSDCVKIEILIRTKNEKEEENSARTSENNKSSSSSSLDDGNPTSSHGESNKEMSEIAINNADIRKAEDPKNKRKLFNVKSNETVVKIENEDDRGMETVDENAGNSEDETRSQVTTEDEDDDAEKLVTEESNVICEKQQEKINQDDKNNMNVLKMEKENGEVDCKKIGRIKDAVPSPPPRVVNEEVVMMSSTLTDLATVTKLLVTRAAERLERRKWELKIVSPNDNQDVANIASCTVLDDPLVCFGSSRLLCGNSKHHHHGRLPQPKGIRPPAATQPTQVVAPVLVCRLPGCSFCRRELESKKLLAKTARKRQIEEIAADHADVMFTSPPRQRRMKSGDVNYGLSSSDPTNIRTTNVRTTNNPPTISGGGAALFPWSDAVGGSSPNQGRIEFIGYQPMVAPPENSILLLSGGAVPQQHHPMVFGPISSLQDPGMVLVSNNQTWPAAASSSFPPSTSVCYPIGMESNHHHHLTQPKLLPQYPIMSNSMINGSNLLSENLQYVQVQPHSIGQVTTPTGNINHSFDLRQPTTASINPVNFDPSSATRWYVLPATVGLSSLPYVYYPGT